MKHIFTVLALALVSQSLYAQSEVKAFKPNERVLVRLTMRLNLERIYANTKIEQTLHYAPASVIESFDNGTTDVRYDAKPLNYVTGHELSSDIYRAVGCAVNRFNKKICQVDEVAFDGNLDADRGFVLDVFENGLALVQYQTGTMTPILDSLASSFSTEVIHIDDLGKKIE